MLNVNLYCTFSIMLKVLPFQTLHQYSIKMMNSFNTLENSHVKFGTHPGSEEGSQETVINTQIQPTFCRSHTVISACFNERRKKFRGSCTRCLYTASVVHNSPLFLAGFILCMWTSTQVKDGWLYGWCLKVQLQYQLFPPLYPASLRKLYSP